eukprot:3305703-Prorocentrum_lima.AAC.1
MGARKGLSRARRGESNKGVAGCGNGGLAEIVCGVARVARVVVPVETCGCKDTGGAFGITRLAAKE